MLGKYMYTITTQQSNILIKTIKLNKHEVQYFSLLKHVQQKYSNSDFEVYLFIFTFIWLPFNGDI